MSNDAMNLPVKEEVILTKFEGDPTPGKVPVEVVRVNPDGTQTRLNPLDFVAREPTDPTLGVIASG